MTFHLLAWHVALSLCSIFINQRYLALYVRCCVGAICFSSCRCVIACDEVIVALLEFIDIWSVKNIPLLKSSDVDTISSSLKPI